MVTASSKTERGVSEPTRSVTTCPHGTEGCEWGGEPHYLRGTVFTVGFPLCDVPDVLTAKMDQEQP